MRSFMRSLLPPVALPLLRRVAREGIWFTGCHATWAEAAKQAVGYDDDQILEKVTRATEAVLEGKAACERDSFLFAEHIYPYPILAVLLRAALDRTGGDLTVLDFGGSLGSTYRQCAPLLKGISVSWRVVEQAHFVERGKGRFETNELRFFPSIEAAAKAGPVDVILLSSVLQYLEDPMAVLGQLEAIPAGYLVVDRTPFQQGDNDYCVVQHVSPRLYRASYPCWAFSEKLLRRHLARQWEPLMEIPCAEGLVRSGLRPITFKGFYARRRTKTPES